jgi:hypothetical protein
MTPVQVLPPAELQDALSDLGHVFADVEDGHHLVLDEDLATDMATRVGLILRSVELLVHGEGLDRPPAIGDQSVLDALGGLRVLLGNRNDHRQCVIEPNMVQVLRRGLARIGDHVELLGATEAIRARSHQAVARAVELLAEAKLSPRAAVPCGTVLVPAEFVVSMIATLDQILPTLRPAVAGQVRPLRGRLAQALRDASPSAATPHP